MGHRRLDEIVVVRGLVVEDRDGARRTLAERVLYRCIGEASRRENGDIFGGLVGGAPDLVEAPAVGSVQRADRAVRGDTGRVGGCIDVARRLGRAAAGATRTRGPASTCSGRAARAYR